MHERIDSDGNNAIKSCKIRHYWVFFSEQYLRVRGYLMSIIQPTNEFDATSIVSLRDAYIARLDNYIKSGATKSPWKFVNVFANFYDEEMIQKLLLIAIDRTAELNLEHASDMASFLAKNTKDYPNFCGMVLKKWQEIEERKIGTEAKPFIDEIPIVGPIPRTILETNLDLLRTTRVDDAKYPIIEGLCVAAAENSFTKDPVQTIDFFYSRLLSGSSEHPKILTVFYSLLDRYFQQDAEGAITRLAKLSETSYLHIESPQELNIIYQFSKKMRQYAVAKPEAAFQRLRLFTKLGGQDTVKIREAVSEMLFEPVLDLVKYIDVLPKSDRLELLTANTYMMSKAGVPIRLQFAMVARSLAQQFNKEPVNKLEAARLAFRACGLDEDAEIILSSSLDEAIPFFGNGRTTRSDALLEVRASRTLDLALRAHNTWISGIDNIAKSDPQQIIEKLEARLYHQTKPRQEELATLDGILWDDTLKSWKNAVTILAKRDPSAAFEAATRNRGELSKLKTVATEVLTLVLPNVPQITPEMFQMTHKAG